MKNTIRSKTAANRFICLLMISMLLLSLTGSAFMVPYEDDPVSHSAYLAGEDFDDDLTIIDVAYWHDDEFDLIMPLSALSLGVTGRATGSTSVYLEGTLFNPDGEFITFRGFWLRRDGCDEVLQVAAERVHGIGGGSFSAPVGNLQAGATYNIRAVARIPGMEASARQSSAMRITLPGPQTATPPPGNTPTPTPGGGTTPTPTPGGGTTPTPTPGGGTTPTPTTPTPPPTPNLSFASNAAPWNGDVWNINSGQITINSVVNAYQRWSWSIGGDANDWLSVSGSGEPGANLTINVRRNDDGVRRQATITVTSGSLSRSLRILQLPAMTSIRGTRVIENFARAGYADVSSATTTTIRYAGKSSAGMPIWNFVHVEDNIFMIRNETTGRYFTETGGLLTHEGLVSGTGANINRQRWRLLPQTDGSYRIRSASDGSLYVENDGAALMLTSRSSSNRQLWWIGYIWHYHRAYDHYWVGFWRGTINIRAEALEGTANTSDFYQAVIAARSIWVSALGVTFNGNITYPSQANIRIYWGTPEQFRVQAGMTIAPRTRYGATLEAPVGHGRTHEDTFIAGGATRNVYRLHGTGGIGMISGVWSHHGSRSVSLAPFTVTHELGHALGYWGHSPNPNDVMRRDVERWQTPDSVLRPAEIEHIRQIYRRFGR